MDNKKIAVVLPTFNQKDITAGTIKKLKKQTIKFDIIVVDNGSSDGTFEFLSKLFDDIIIIKTKENYGGGGAQNIGCHYAFDVGYEWIIASDNDAIPVSRNLIETLVNESDEKTICHPLNIAEETPKEYSFLMAHYTCYNRKILKKLGFMYLKFFIYYDDIEYSYRASKLAKLKKITSVTYSHPRKKSYPPSRFYFTVRNSLHTIRKHKPVITRMIYSLIVLNSIFVYYLIGEKNYAKFGLYGYFDYLINRFNNQHIKVAVSPAGKLERRDRKQFIAEFKNGFLDLTKLTNSYLGFAKVSEAGSSLKKIINALKSKTAVEESIVNYNLIPILYLTRKIVCIEEVSKEYVTFREYKTPNLLLKFLNLLLLNILFSPLTIAVFVKNLLHGYNFEKGFKYNDCIEKIKKRKNSEG